MSARSIGELVAPIVVNAIGIANLQRFLSDLPSRSDRKWWVMEWRESGVISDDETELLIEHNNLEAA